GAQTSIGAALTQMPNAPRMPAIVVLRAALISTLPWIPVTLAAIALALRFPFTRATWRRHVGIHVAATLLLAVVANALVVLGFSWTSGTFPGLMGLARNSVIWAAARLHVAALVYGSSVAITQTVLYLQRARTRELDLARIEAQLARAQVQALNAQIRPHFLFNTLHTIGQLWRSGQSDDADAVLDHLGALFHKVQASTSQVTIPLAEELAIVRDYLAIEETRYRDRLRTRITAHDAALECPVPPLILQPIVENAVRHGISTISTAGRLEVSAECMGDTLRLVVRDDGPGPNEKAASPGSGMGLRNTKERLAQMYGQTAELRIEGDAASGTTVTITVPLSAASAR
ncbi:MAG TPA: histidine kinase, partial [Gemmatimonadaceae bacterium]|nr:histidine kinase [Gemmatimonadaceae bacterium]